MTFVAGQVLTAAEMNDLLAATVPTGGVMSYIAATAPTGWLLCDGAAVSRTTYADLFTVISTTYGVGNGTTTFNVPNLKGRVPVGRDSAQTEFDALAETGGAKTHTLTTAQMPSHNHTVADSGHTHEQVVTANANSGGTGTRQDYDLDATGLTAYTQGVSTQSATTGITIANNGSGQAHNILQPYLVLNYIIKT